MAKTLDAVYNPSDKKVFLPIEEGSYPAHITSLTTKEQNTILGTKGFSAKRTALIKRFKNASLENKANIVNQLNTLAEKYVPGRLQYNVKKDGSLKITNLQPEKTFKSRAAAYLDLAKDFPVNIKRLILNVF